MFLAVGKNPRNAEYIKDYNRKLFLRLLRSAPMSRSELARRMGVTRSATAKIAEELLEEGCIAVTEGTPVGRTSAPLTLCPDWGYAVGIYLNRDGCRIGLVDICGGLHGEIRLHLEDRHASEKPHILAEAIREMAVRENIPHQKILGVGICAPGPLDGEQGRILNPPRFDLWHNMPLGNLLQEELALPVYLENNASCLARFQQGRPEAGGSDDFLLLLVDSGVGSGVISGGKVLKGAGYFTSELGHTSIDYRGRPCACGNIGCLEAYAAIPNLLQGTEFTSWHQVIDRLPEAEAEKLLNREAGYLAAGIVNLTNVVSIDTVLLAGDLLYGIEKMAPILEKEIHRRSFRRNSIPIRVQPACFGKDVWIRAAADIAFGRFLTA